MKSFSKADSTPPTVGSVTGDVTITWSGAEGGTYRIDHSEDLTNWKPLHDSATNNAGSFGGEVDSARAASAPSQFYRNSLTALACFYDTGFDYSPLVYPSFTASLPNNPNTGDKRAFNAIQIITAP